MRALVIAAMAVLVAIVMLWGKEKAVDTGGSMLASWDMADLIKVGAKPSGMPITEDVSVSGDTYQIDTLVGPGHGRFDLILGENLVRFGLAADVFPGGDGHAWNAAGRVTCDHISAFGQRVIVDENPCDVTEFKGGRLAAVEKAEFRFDIRGVFGDLFKGSLNRDIRTDLGMTDSAICADRGTGLSKGEPKCKQTKYAQGYAYDARPPDEAGPPRHFLLRLQILIGYCLIAIGFYLVYKTHSDDVDGRTGDGAALSYLAGGFIAVFLGSLVLLPVYFP